MAIDTSIAITIGGIAVYDEGVKERVGRTGKEATRVLRCAWSDRQALYNYLMGGSQQIGTANVYAAGQPYPDDTRLQVDRIEMDGEGIPSVGPNGMIAFERAVLRVEYKVPEANFGDPLLIGAEELDFSSTAIALDQGESVFKWTSGPNSGNDLPPSALPAVTFSTTTFVKERYRVPVLPADLIRSLIDHSNSTTLFGAPAETVILRGARSRRQITAAGERNWDIAYYMEENTRGWNKLPDGANGFQTFAFKSGSTKLFPTADLNLLFTS